MKGGDGCPGSPDAGFILVLSHSFPFPDNQQYSSACIRAGLVNQ